MATLFTCDPALTAPWIYDRHGRWMRFRDTVLPLDAFICIVLARSAYLGKGEVTAIPEHLNQRASVIEANLTRERTVEVLGRNVHGVFPIGGVTTTDPRVVRYEKDSGKAFLHPVYCYDQAEPHAVATPNDVMVSIDDVLADWFAVATSDFDDADRNLTNQAGVRLVPIYSHCRWGVRISDYAPTSNPKITGFRRHAGENVMHPQYGCLKTRQEVVDMPQFVPYRGAGIGAGHR